MGDLLHGDDSDGEIKFTINENYANKYEKWRSKEISQHWKDVHRKKSNVPGKWESQTDDRHSNADDSSSDDDNSLNFDKPFLQLLDLFKSDDPNKYDKIKEMVPTVDLFPTKSKTKEDKPLVLRPFVLRDYERNLIVEKGGKLSDDEEMPERDSRSLSPTYVEEQKMLKNNLKKVLEDSDSEDDIGNLLTKKNKTKEEIQKEEDDYIDWLKGRKKELQDKETESQLKNLHEYWNDPKLDSGEVFLRDYILNFKSSNDSDHLPIYNGVPLDSFDSNFEQVNDRFESKYNFRFEEPDQEFIKRYPRTVQTSFRKTDDRRKEKRQEIKERKKAEMAAKMEEIKQLKAIKRKEILSKIEQIKKITGNEDVNLQDDDLEDDFNPDKHDQKMRELFNDDYYQVEEEDKPECPELERELEIENWEDWQGKDAQDEEYNEYSGNNSWDQPECEDAAFNMDCDYDPQAELQSELLSMTKSKKKQRRKSRFAAALAKQKPIFDPNDKKFEQYFDEYYKLDCEDIIGDMPCRFKYRQTTPNDYGLTVDEILRADVKELNKWCSLKKVVKYKPEHVEKYEVQEYKKKAHNEALKRKILPSLYIRTESEVANEVNSEGRGKKKKKRKFQENNENEHEYEYEYEPEPNFSDKIMHSASPEKFNKQEKTTKKKKRKSQGNNEDEYEHEHDTKFSDKIMNSGSLRNVNKPEKNYSPESLVKVGSEGTEKRKKKKRKLHENDGTEHAYEYESNFSDKVMNSESLKNDNKPEKNYSLESLPKVNSEGIEKKKKKKRKLHEDNGTEHAYEHESNFSVKTMTNGSIENFNKQEKINSVLKPKKFKPRKFRKSIEESKHHQNSEVQKVKLYNQTKNKKSKYEISDSNIPVSDDRLKAYGINPKKFKNKMKYGKNQNNWS